MTARTAPGKVVVLDRDGTIVVDRGYLDDPDGLEFLPGAAPSLRSLHESGHRLVIVTNQSGIGRGLFSLDRLQAIHERLLLMVRREGADLERIYFCPHAPQDACSCRKPQTGLLLQAAADLGFDPASAIVVGDKQSDVEFGWRAGATTFLLSAPGAPAAAAGPPPDFVVADLPAVVRAIRGFGPSAQPPRG